MDINKQMTKDHLEFTELLKNIRDPLSALLRVHLIIEQSLEKIITLHLCSPETLLKDGRLTFNQKILLVGSFNVLDKKVYNAIRKLNDIRNACAHNLEAELNSDTVEKLGNELRPWFTKIKKENPGNHEEWLGYILPYLAGKTAAYSANKA